MRCIAGAAREAIRGVMVLLLLGGWFAGAAAQGQPALPPVQLSDTQPPVYAQGLAGTWLDPRGTANSALLESDSVPVS